MIYYYLHHTPDCAPLQLTSDYPLDVQPGAVIWHQDRVFEVMAGYPVVQNPEVGHSVHVAIKWLDEVSGYRIRDELAAGTFYKRLMPEQN